MSKYFIFIAGFAALIALLVMALVLLRGESEKVFVEKVIHDKVTTTTTTTTQTQIGEIASSSKESIAEQLTETECVFIDNFSGGSSQLSWFAVNDGVMGGLSAGAVSLGSNELVHTGTINTNGGGFSSVRARLPADVLVGYARLQIRLNTFGRQYAVNFGDNRYRNVSHRVVLPPSSGDAWQEVSVEFDQTIPTRIGFRVAAEPFAASAINEIGLILADGVDGPFRMEVEWIKACS